ncbi:MAG: serine/threonine-protein phosphatase [Betaproteobacteria bacterium]|nr:MAG: serine/threonine-protein phosphatase [Betaproteobacteria bacterium]
MTEESAHTEVPAKNEANASSHRPLSGTAEVPGALAIGYASAAVGEKTNEDCFGVVTPREMPEAAKRGTAVALADGGSAGGTGRVASEVTVRALLQDFYATPAQWSVERAIDTVLCSVNDWLYVQNGRDPEFDGVVSTLSMLLFSGGRFNLAHVGDTRVYRWQAGTLERLTADHTWPRRDMRHVLRRAVGLDNHLVIDFQSGQTRVDDIFLVASDGVWEVLGNTVLEEVLAGDGSVEVIAAELVGRSVQSQRRYMGHNDATALAIRITGSGR